MTAADEGDDSMCRVAVAVVGLLLGSSSVLADEANVRRAIERGLRRSETAAARYAENRACFSCHHQLAVPVLAAASDRGFQIDRWLLWAQIEFTRESFRLKLDQVRKGQG